MTPDERNGRNRRIKDLQLRLAQGEAKTLDDKVDIILEIQFLQYDICEDRPVQCAGARARTWSRRRTLLAWAAGLLVAALSVCSMIVTLAGG